MKGRFARNKKIVFEGPKGANKYLSNQFSSTFFEDGINWPSVEHYFQAYKFAGNPYVETVRTAATPDKAKEYGQTRKIKLRKDWEQEKDSIMRNGMRLKFSQNTKLRDALIDTGNAKIIFEGNDDYWGTGPNGKGQNNMGENLMAIRDELKNL